MTVNLLRAHPSVVQRRVSHFEQTKPPLRVHTTHIRILALTIMFDSMALSQDSDSRFNVDFCGSIPPPVSLLRG